MDPEDDPLSPYRAAAPPLIAGNISMTKGR
jgi:hypothetical protein